MMSLSLSSPLQSAIRADPSKVVQDTILMPLKRDGSLQSVGCVMRARILCMFHPSGPCSFIRLMLRAFDVHCVHTMSDAQLGAAFDLACGTDSVS